METDVLFDRLRSLLINYRKTLQSDRRRLLDQFTLTDIAQKVVGLGVLGLAHGFFCLRRERRRKPFCWRPRRLDHRPWQATQANRSTATRESGW
jgi:hypothetical protein